MVVEEVMVAAVKIPKEEANEEGKEEAVEQEPSCSYPIPIVSDTYRAPPENEASNVVC